jgi:PncC family amidohydrolase|tara:strand:- start:93 stop:563 length:471 start_codon:yes stop_codon:yes gene_type:complete
MNTFQQLHDLCVERDMSIATSESCTAGLLASKITSIVGASSFFKGGIIAYQNNIKINLLGVSKSIIKEETEVSSEVVKQMAEGVRNKFLADFSIATSGYAGPTGGTKLNPIGTVFIAIASTEKTISKRFIFAGDRESVVSQAVIRGVEFLISELKN